METRNDVVLVGRLAAPAEQTELPSGDSLTSWRVIVDRPKNGRKLPEGVRATTIDTLQCVAWAAAVQRAATAWTAGDLVSVEGSLRRRFYRTGGAVSSRYEIEVRKARRVARAA